MFDVTENKEKDAMVKEEVAEDESTEESMCSDAGAGEEGRINGAEFSKLSSTKYI